MATRTVVLIEDDIDGSGGAETVSFAFNDSAYEIDLSAAHIEQLREALQPWIDNARRVSSRGSRSSARRAAGKSTSDSPLKGRQTLLASKGLSARQVREWAQENGVEVNPAGRIPDSIISMFESAQSETASATAVPENVTEVASTVASDSASAASTEAQDGSSADAPVSEKKPRTAGKKKSSAERVSETAAS